MPSFHGPLTRYINLRVAHAPGMPGTFSTPPTNKPLAVSDPGMHHGTCVTHVPWCMSGSLARGDGENFPGACATRNFTYLVRGPWRRVTDICVIRVIWNTNTYRDKVPWYTKMCCGIKNYWDEFRIKIIRQCNRLFLVFRDQPALSTQADQTRNANQTYHYPESVVHATTAVCCHPSMKMFNIKPWALNKIVRISHVTYWSVFHWIRI